MRLNILETEGKRNNVRPVTRAMVEPKKERAEQGKENTPIAVL